MGPETLPVNGVRKPERAQDAIAPDPSARGRYPPASPWVPASADRVGRVLLLDVAVAQRVGDGTASFNRRDSGSGAGRRPPKPPDSAVPFPPHPSPEVCATASDDRGALRSARVRLSRFVPVRSVLSFAAPRQPRGCG